MSSTVNYQTQLESFCDGCTNYNPNIKIDRKVNGIPISATISCAHLDACSGIVTRMQNITSSSVTADVEEEPSVE